VSPLHVAGALALFLALCGAAGVIGVKITSSGGQPGPKIIATEMRVGLKPERQEGPARLRDGLRLLKHREYALDTYSHIFAKGNRDTNLKNLPGYQSEGANGGLDLVAVEVTPFSFVNNGAVDEAKPIPRETLFESLAAATEKTKATTEKQPVPKQIAKATRVEVRKGKTKAVASAPAMQRHKSKSPARKPKGTRVKKRTNIENAAERKVAVKEVASPVSRVTEQRASQAIERPAAAKQDHPSSNNSSGECLPRAFRSYIAGRMRPCDYW